MDFNNAAKNYDDDFTYTEVGKMQRALVYDYLKKIEPQNFENVLELNCGTGEDANWLSNFCKNILATDFSPEMVKVAQQKGKANNISYQVLDINNLGQFPEENFDFVFSNFGGLNCISPKQQVEFAHNLKKVLKPNGHFIGVYMGRFSWIEMLYFIFKLKFGEAFRRLTKNPIDVIVEGTPVKTWYFSPKQVINLFDSKLQFVAKKPVGFIVPPSYLNPLFVKIKYWRSKALNADRGFFNRSYFSNGADHFLIHFQKTI